jgi:predicted RNase H-like HicB family nuclease
MVKPEDYLKRPYHRVLIPCEGGGWFAYIQEFPGCMTEGETEAEALEKLREAAINWIDIMLEDEQKVPEPFPEVVKPYKWLGNKYDLHVYGEKSYKIVRDGKTVYAGDNLFITLEKYCEREFLGTDQYSSLLKDIIAHLFQIERRG